QDAATPDDEMADFRWLGAERHADTELSEPLADDVRHHAVHARDREDDSNRAKQTDKLYENPPTGRAGVRGLLHCPDRRDGLIAIRSTDSARERSSHLHRWPAGSCDQRHGAELCT